MMSRLGLFRAAVMVSLAAGCLSAARAEDNDTYNSVKELEAKRKQRLVTGQTLWWEHLIPGRIEAKKKQAEEKSIAAKEAKDKEPPRPKPAEAASAIQQETNKALRRAAVCDRLREIADETNDPELARQADILESRIWALCEQRIATVREPRGSMAADAEFRGRGPVGGRDKPEEPEAAKIRTIRASEKE
jgi:hypothetical protein